MSYDYGVILQNLQKGIAVQNRSVRILPGQLSLHASLDPQCKKRLMGPRDCGRNASFCVLVMGDIGVCEEIKQGHD